MDRQKTKSQRQHLSDLLADAADGLEDRRLSLADYGRQAWPIIEPAVPYLDAWHTDAINDHLEAVWAGQITRLIVNGPPRCGKSLPISVLFPTWIWTQVPEYKIITTSHAQDLATKHSVDRRELIRSDWYQRNWGRRVQLSGDQDLKREFTNTARGHMVARGTGASITGYGGNLIILDDPLDPRKAESALERQACHDFYDGTLYSRLDDKARDIIIINEQRLGVKDMTGHVMGNGEPWVNLVLPSQEGRKRVIMMPASGKEVVREKDAVLWPEREDADTLAKIKTAMGTRRYVTQYLQAPVEDQGNILKRHYWRFYDRIPDDLEEVIQSWDMAFKGTLESDFVVGQIWAFRGSMSYLLDQVRAQLTFTETIGAFERLTSKWPQARRKLVEDKANGPAIINVLGKRITGIVPIDPKSSKLSRVHAIEPLLEAGNISLPQPARHPWVEDLIEECAAFEPEGGHDHDDQVDAMTQALVWRQSRRRSSWRPA